MNWISKLLEYGVIAVLILLLLNKCQNQHGKQLQSVVQLYADTMIQYRNELQQQVSEKATIATDFKTFKSVVINQLAAKDKELARLQNIVNKKTDAAIVFNTVTEYKDRLVPQYIIDSSGKKIKELQLKNEWIDLAVKGNDTAAVDLFVTNKYNVSFDHKNTGFLNIGPVQTTAKITSLNPYTAVNSMNSYVKVDTKPKNRLLKYGLVFISGFAVATYTLTR